jgi:hypothetical protein
MIDMSVGVGTARRSNVIFLINIHGSQTKLARALTPTNLTQQILSRICSNKMSKRRFLKEDEARYIERTLCIPAGWMDRENWVGAGWKLIGQYRKLGVEERAIASSLSTFVLERLSVEAH